MRTRTWLKSLLSGCLLAAGAVTAQAQNPPFEQFGPGNPDATGMLPPPYNANYAYFPQAYSGLPEGGYPPEANAWPTISPFAGPPYDETSYQNGFWYNRQGFGGKRFFFDADVVFGNASKPHTFLGAPNVNLFDRQPGLTYTDQNQQFFETPFATDGTRNRTVGAGGGGGGAGGDVRIFEPQSVGRLEQKLWSTGTKISMGWFGPDDAGLELSGLWLDRANSSLFLGHPGGYDISQDPFTDYRENHIRAFAGLPLGGADTDNSFSPGVVIPFDIYYRLQYNTQLMGSSLDWYFNPAYRTDKFMIRPLAGARVMRLKENFVFDGLDSGLEYTIQGASAGQNNNAAQQVYGPLTFGPEFNILDLMRSYLDATTKTIVAGPEVGFRMDLGGEKFRLITGTKFGLLANNTQRHIQGYNIGDAVNGTRTVIAGVPIITNPMPRGSGLPVALGGAGDTRFNRDDTNTALSPSFEQSISMKAPLFQYVPLLKRSRILQEAQFEAGFTTLLIGNTYRASEIIDWQAYPVNPLLRDHRTTYINNMWNFGIEWNY